ncbi:MAG: lactate utilization protein [Faecalimonas sp.]|nr:lactate utilization protein [Faecalimonas sp.]
MTPKKQAYAKLAKSMIQNLKERNMEAFYCDTKEEATALAMDLMKDAKTVGMGGAQTISECGLLDAIQQSETLHFIDRSLATTPVERKACFLETMAADYFLMSTNAITVDGELINVDGNGNRVACLIHGPEHVLVIAGMNKVVESIDAGIERIGIYAAPPNAARLGTRTPCNKLGHCGDCHSEDCMCCQYVITRHSRHKGRIKVILVGEELGY